MQELVRSLGHHMFLTQRAVCIDHAERILRPPQELLTYKGDPVLLEKPPAEAEPLINSCIVFSLNGRPQGIAYRSAFWHSLSRAEGGGRGPHDIKKQ